MGRTDVFCRNATRLDVVAHISVLIFHSHDKRMEMGNLFSRDSRPQAAVQAATAKRTHRHLGVSQEPFLHGPDKGFPDEFARFVYVRQQVVLNLRYLVVRNKALLGRIIMTGREFMHFFQARKRHGAQLRTEVKTPVLVPVVERLDTNGIPPQHEVVAVKNRKGEHAIQIFHTIGPFFSIEVKNDLRVGLCLKPVEGR